MSARITWKLRSQTSPNSCAYCLWPWLGPPLMALRYVMYFRFYRLRHVFILWDQWAEGHGAAGERGRWQGDRLLRPTGSLAGQAGLLGPLVGADCPATGLSCYRVRLCTFRCVLHASSELVTGGNMGRNLSLLSMIALFVFDVSNDSQWTDAKWQIGIEKGPGPNFEAWEKAS